MANELATMSKEVRVTSVELVATINEFRKQEAEITSKPKSELLHKNLMEKIRTELEVLESMGLNGQLNFQPSSYTNLQNKEQPCYLLNRDGIMQIAMSESAVVRYKVIEYVNVLEKEIKQLQGKANLLLAIYNGGQEGVEASKLLTELEVKEATKPLLETIEVQQPKVDFADRLLKTKDNILVREFAKVLKDEGLDIGEKKLYKWLRSEGYLMSNNEPYQRYMDNKTFYVKVNIINTAFGDKQTRTTLITPTGQLYLFKKLKTYMEEN